MLKIVSGQIKDFVPKTYLDIGHGYKQDPDTGETIEHRQPYGSVILWYFMKDGTIDTEIRNRSSKTHSFGGNEEAYGRIDTQSNVGSVEFIWSGEEHYRMRKQIIETLISKFPNIRFYVFGQNQIMPLQQYWETLEY